MNRNEWQSIQAIHMSIQSVDLHHIGVQINKELNISCGLINIAKGSVILEFLLALCKILKRLLGICIYLQTGQ